MAEHILEFTMGDPSADGHSQTFSGFIKTNHSNAELNQAMEKFEVETGIHWRNWCREYEECTIPYEDAVKAAEYLNCAYDELPCDEWEDDIEDHPVPWHCPQTFVSFLMKICKVALPDLEWKWHKFNTECAFFDGMGYGLFD